MRRVALTVAAMMVAAVVPAGADGPGVGDIIVSPLKDGRRVAVTWRTDVPTTGYVEYGPAPGGTLVAGPVGAGHHVDAPGLRHLVTIDVPRWQRYWVRVTAVDASGATSTGEEIEFGAFNGPGGWDADLGAYRANVLVRFDWDLTAGEMAAWAGHATEFATRVADMTDGYVLLGDVILADAVGRDAIWVQGCTPCPTDADVAVFTGYGVSVYPPAGPRVTAMWQQSSLGGIQNDLDAIEFPRSVLWGGELRDMTNEWWTGRRLAHEFGHYAFWLEDQYDGAVCENPEYDISIMNDDLRFSEIDSADTPCDWQAANAGTSWDKFLFKHYKNVGFRTGPPDPGPDAPGSIFRLIALDRGVA